MIHGSDGAELALRVRSDLEAVGFEIGTSPADSDALVAILSPGAVGSDVFLAELADARFGAPPRPIVPVMAMGCDVPLIVFRLQYIDMRAWDAPGYAEAVGKLAVGLRRVLDGAAGAEPSAQPAARSD